MSVLRDKNGKLFLLSAPHDRQIGLTGLEKLLNANNLRFAKEDLLREKLGVEPGCLCPFAIANDVHNEVQFLVDRELLEDDNRQPLFHPLVNTATLSVPAGGLAVLAKHTGHHMRGIKLM